MRASNSVLALGAFAIGAVAALAMPSAAAQGHARLSDSVVRCESRDGRPERCAADTHRSHVRLLRQLSRSACVENRTWGVTRGGIWVGDGCRAEFLVARSRRGSSAPVSDFIRCESSGGRSGHCPVDAPAGVELVRQLSRSPCIQGRSWGWDDTGIWVSGGCRAEFRAIAGRDRDVGAAD